MRQSYFVRVMVGALAASALSSPLIANTPSRTELYRVTNVQPGVCVPGEVTTRQGHKGCQTEAIGALVGVRSDVAHLLLVGITPGKSDGMVTMIESHLGGQTTAIGFTLVSKDAADSQPLFMGAEPLCNLGIVSTAQDHGGCHTIFLGWTSRR